MRSLTTFKKLLLDYGNAAFDCGECDGLDVDPYLELYEKLIMARRACIQWAKKSKKQNTELKKQLAESEALFDLRAKLLADHKIKTRQKAKRRNGNIE